MSGNGSGGHLDREDALGLDRELVAGAVVLAQIRAVPHSDAIGEGGIRHWVARDTRLARGRGRDYG